MDEQASLMRCMDVVGVIIKANDVNGVPAAERAILGYLNTRSGNADLREGIDAVEGCIGDLEENMRRESDIAETLRAFLDAQRRKADEA